MKRYNVRSFILLTALVGLIGAWVLVRSSFTEPQKAENLQVTERNESGDVNPEPFSDLVLDHPVTSQPDVDNEEKSVPVVAYHETEEYLLDSETPIADAMYGDVVNLFVTTQLSNFS